MIITATGLHGSGKSYLLDYISKRLDVPYFHKRHKLQSMSPETDSFAWYRSQYVNLGAYAVLKNILEFLPQHNGIIVFDAIHNLAELKALREYDEQTILIGVFCPKEVRLARNKGEDQNLDKRRVSYWHEPDLGSESQCLLAEIEWVFNGCMTNETMEINISQFIEYLNTIKN